MNHIYKVVWSKVRNCYVAVSEIAKGHGKKSPSEKWGGKKAALLAAVIFTLGIGGTVGAAGPAATEHGPASKADGIASIAVGVGDHVVSSNTDANRFQGATSLAVGTLNIVDADANAPFDGAASSVIGQVNYTKNANAAIIMGAGNKVTNSYRDVSGLDEATINKIMGYYQKGQMDKVTEILQKAVPNSGGQVMVMGGGNTVDYAQASQVMGVSNILKGTKDAASKYNLVDGFQNNVDKVQNTYVVGANNKIDNTQNTIVIGDNHSGPSYIHGTKNSVIIGNGRTIKDGYGYLYDQDKVVSIGDSNLVHRSNESVAIGNNVIIKRDGSGNYGFGTGNVAIGSQAYINSYVNQSDSIAIGKKATVANMAGTLENNFAFGTAEGKDYYGSIAIGENSYARSGSTMIGVHDYHGQLGDIDIDFTKGKSEGPSGIGNYQASINATTIGNNSYNNGTFSTVLGSYTAVSGIYKNAKWGENPHGIQNLGAAVVGSLNSVQGLSSKEYKSSGMADSILGSANQTKNANGTVMVGAGNVVTNSIKDFDATDFQKTTGFDNPNSLSDAMRTAIKAQNGGGAAAVVGNGNIVDNATNVSILGSKNSLKNTAKAQLLGDNRDVDGADNSVIVGSAKETMATTNKNVTVLGYNANASVDGGVALGSDSAVGDSDKSGKDLNKYGFGYAKRNASDADYVWQSNLASVSVGSAGYTRRMTNVAAGIDSTDAVNVAQLKAAMSNAGSNINLVAGDGIKIDTNNGTYTISANITGGTTATDTTTVTPKDSNSGTSGDSASTDKGNTDTSGNGKGLVVTTETNPTKFAADEGTAAAVKPSETLTINGDKTNIATKVDGNAISVKLNDDISVKTVNATDSIGIKDGPSMTKDGIDAAGKKITHVAAGTETTDAVNYGQLKDVESKVDGNSQAITNINSHVNRLDNRINKVGAGAAALAGLHPLDFDPSDKWNFAVGYGNYRNANSVAVGAFYRPNEDTMVSVGTNFGNGENMVNAGVSFKLGQGSSYAGVSKAELAEENQKLKANDAAQDQKIQNQEKEIQELKKALEELKSHIK
ncbi:ESPR-type extended signal peptide-containing protein [Dialister succinatiphilus]|uniref:ESPR-type extended signal peptide-containing protein n=1 Tax=Dialister succinatiphilus TaxID=487173 RepID=UPI003F7EAD65